MATADIKVAITADTSSLTAGMRQAEAALSNVGDAAAAAAAKTERSFNRASWGMTNVNAQLADITKGLLSGQSPFTILTQQGDQLAQAVSQAGGASAVFSATLGTIAAMAPYIAATGAAALALYGAYQSLYGEQIKQEAINVKISEATRALTPLYEDQRKAVVELQVATGELTKAQGKQIDEAIDAVGRWKSATDDLRKSLADNRREQESVTTQMVDNAGAVIDLVASYQKWNPVAKVVQSAFDGLTTSSADLRAEYDALQSPLQTSIDLLGANADAHKRTAAATGGHTKAIKDQTAALDDQTALAARNAQQYRSALDAIDAMSFGLKKNKSDVENLSDAYHANLEAIKASEMEALAVVSGNADAEYTARHAALIKSMEAQAAYYRDVEALREASAARAAAAAEEGLKLRRATEHRQTEIARKGEQDRLDIQAAYQEAGASIAGSVGDAFALAQQNMTGLSKKEAAVLFRVTQAAQLAQALLLTPAAILQGLAQAGPAGGIAAGIAAGVQVAAIAAAKPPSFRQGTSGYFGAPAGEKAITAHVGEGEGIAVVSRQGMANSRAEGVDARNAGLSGGSGGPLSVNLTMSGRVVGRVMVDASRGASGRSAVQAAAKSSFTNPYRRAA